MKKDFLGRWELMFLVFCRTTQFTLAELYTVFRCMVCVYELFTGWLFGNFDLSSECSQETRCKRLIWVERRNIVSHL